MVSLTSWFNDVKHKISLLKTTEELNKYKISLLGKSGEITTKLRDLKNIPPDQRAKEAQALNTVKDDVINLILVREKTLQEKELLNSMENEKIDISLPAYIPQLGQKHPISLVIERIITFFEDKNDFSPVYGPEIETEETNFTALNIPPHHPARGMHDTFYLDGTHLLRTHTTTMEIRALRKQKPPLKLFTYGKVYRSDSDNTHTPMFHQCEGMRIDDIVSFADLFSMLKEFLIFYFDNPALKIRFRPSYFPFTEPSAEVDIGCTICNQKKCSVCKNTGWVEVLGCGMLHPDVIQRFGRKWYSKNSNKTKHHISGYAFGIGIERLAMLKYNLSDIRDFYASDLRFLSQFINEI